MINRHPILFSFVFVGLAFGLLMMVFIALIAVSGGGGTLLPFGDIAVLKLEGPIFDSTDMIKKIDHVRMNKSIKAVVVRIDSPGGGVAPSQEIFEELKKLKKEKI